ncbi:MAG: hypothetical protein JW765_01525 [Deltaproteobacteria bacterium]|nr:hypothetical protein [Candidatus Zymogenaceae bacterium]
MRKRSLSVKARRIVLAVLSLMCLVSPACSYAAEDELTAFLKNIGYFGQTKEEMEEKLGTPNVVTHDTAGHFVTTYYYPGLEAVFDDLTDRVSVLSITDNAWTVDASVSIGAAKRDVISALGDDYCRLVEDGAIDVWVYFCPKASSDVQARLCDHCRVCYIFFENNRVSQIEWSTEILGDY